jgi:hypothetical protein
MCVLPGKPCTPPLCKRTKNATINPIQTHMYAPHYKDSIATADTASVAHQWLAHGNYLRTSLFADPSGSMQACLLKAPVTGSTLQQGICAGSGAPVSCSPLQQSQMHEAGQLPLGLKLRPLARTTHGPARHWPSLGCLALGGLKGSPPRILFGQGGQRLFDHCRHVVVIAPCCRHTSASGSFASS